MKKFIVISLIIHVLLGIGFIFLNDNKIEQKNVYQQNNKSSSFENKEEEYISKNNKREIIMNAIAISEDELATEIQRITSAEKLRDTAEEQKQKLLEEAISIEKRQFKREKENDLKNIQEKEEFLKNETKKLKLLQKDIIKENKKLSQKENSLLQQYNEISVKKNENLKILDYVNSTKGIKDKELKQKQKHIQEQGEYIERQEVEIENLRNQLKKEYRNKIKSNQTVITDKKQKKNSFLDKLSIEEQNKLKIEMKKYNLIIKNKINEKWDLPKNTQKTNCIINLTQSKNGIVLAVQLSKCSDDQYLKNSIKKAVWEASPLPLPKNKILFDKHIQLYFTVK